MGYASYLEDIADRLANDCGEVNIEIPQASSIQSPVRHPDHASATRAKGIHQNNKGLSRSSTKKRMSRRRRKTQSVRSKAYKPKTPYYNKPHEGEAWKDAPDIDENKSSIKVRRRSRSHNWTPKRSSKERMSRVTTVLERARIAK